MIERFTIDSTGQVEPDPNGQYVAYDDHLAEIDSSEQVQRCLCQTPFCLINILDARALKIHMLIDLVKRSIDRADCCCYRSDGYTDDLREELNSILCGILAADKSEAGK